MQKVLFICQGNVGRSQIAEGFFNSMQKKYKGISAGIDDVGSKYEYKPYEPIVKIMKDAYGIDISEQRVKQIKPSDILGVKHIVLLCEEAECLNKIPSYIVSHKGLERIPIMDPNKKTQEAIEDIIKKIYSTIQINVQKLGL